MCVLVDLWGVSCAGFVYRMLPDDGYESEDGGVWGCLLGSGS